MIWATVSSWSCFCWLYRASPSLAAKNIINMISVLTIWGCPCVESFLVFAMTSVFSWQNSVSLCPALYSKAKFACYFRYLLTSYFCLLVPYNETTCFSMLVLKDLVVLHRPIQPQLLQYYYLGHRLGLLWYWNVPWKWTEIILSFLRLHPRTAFQTFLLILRAIPFLLRDSFPQ